MNFLKKMLNEILNSFLTRRLNYLFPAIHKVDTLNRFDNVTIESYKNAFADSTIGEHSSIHPPYKIYRCSIGNHTYIASGSHIQLTNIGHFCSIGPNLVCGYGIHPTNGLSTSPEFYSTRKQTGHTFSQTDKIEELKPISVGNDVFIGMNVSILDGVTIGDGAVIAAGAVVTKNVPPYAIVGGIPAQIIKYRFDEITIAKLLKIKWWEFPEDKLKEVEKHFFNVDEFLTKFHTY
jgi:acetyltransferase-like isoleucine patch superfamily enzyme